MKTNYIKQSFWPLVLGAAVFAALFVLLNSSLAQGTNQLTPEQIQNLLNNPNGTLNINAPSEIYDHDKAVAVAKTKGGPGGCKSEAACNTFCNNLDNQAACMDWSKANGVISNENYDKYNDFAKSGGPGGCKGEDKCKKFCENGSNQEECIGFAEKQGIITKEQAQQARKTGPGGCKTQDECQAFCNQPQNLDICIGDSAVQAGFISQEDSQRIRDFQSRAEEFKKKMEEFGNPPEIKKIDAGIDEEKAKQILATSGGPGGCKTFEECGTFCGNPSNQEACFTFAEQHGLFKNQGDADKIKQIMKEGGPGGCHGEDECKKFCENADNADSCLSFAEKQGLLPPEEIQRAKNGLEALKEGGPQGCKTRETCDAICKDPANQDACFEWAKKNNLIPEEQLKFIEESKKLREQFQQNGQGGFQGQGGFGPQGGQPPGGFPGGGPSGFFQPTPENGGTDASIRIGHCQTVAECQQYCQAHAEECQKYNVPEKGECVSGIPEYKELAQCQGYCASHETECALSRYNLQVFSGGGGQPSGGGFGGTGGCTSQEECTKYCSDPSHHTECAQFAPPGGGTPPPSTPPPPTSQSCIPPPSGLVSWWNGDAVSGTTASDIKGGNNGTMLNGVAILPGTVAKAFKFSGTNGYVKVGNPASLNFGTGPFSLEAWFNWDGGGTINNIIRKSNYPVSGPGAGYFLRTGSGTAVKIPGPIVEFFTGDSVGEGAAPSGHIYAAINPPGWYHAVGTRDAVGTMRLYLNGELAGSLSVPEANTTSNAPFTIGAWDDRFGVTELFHGLIEEVSVYNRALSASEVHAIFNAGDAGKCSTSSGTPPPSGFTSPPNSTSPDPETTCAQQGGIWNGSQCDMAATMCAQQGGSWDGKTCQFPQPSSPTGTTSPSSLLQYSPFGAILNFFLGR